MLNWLQHLFTARAIESELAESRKESSILREQNLLLNLEVEKLKQVITVKDEEISRLKNYLENSKGNHPRRVDGADEKYFGID